MAPRAIKKISIDILGARLGVAVMTAVDEHAGLKFTTCHRTDGGEVKQPRVCGTCKLPLKAEDILKEYTFEDGVKVEVLAEDFEFAAGERGSVFKVDRFIPRHTLNPVATDKSYYLLPLGREDVSYASLAEAMTERGVVGITNGMLGSAERLFAIVPVGGRALVLQQLYYAEDIRNPEKLGALVDGDADLADAFGAVIDTILDPTGDLSDIKDEFADRMTATLMLKKKGILKGRKPAPPAEGTDIGMLRRIINGILGRAGAALPREHVA